MSKRQQASSARSIAFSSMWASAWISAARPSTVRIERCRSAVCGTSSGSTGRPGMPGGSASGRSAPTSSKGPSCRAAAAFRSGSRSSSTRSAASRRVGVIDGFWRCLSPVGRCRYASGAVEDNRRGSAHCRGRADGCRRERRRCGKRFAVGRVPLGAGGSRARAVRRIASLESPLGTSRPACRASHNGSSCMAIHRLGDHRPQIAARPGWPTARRSSAASSWPKTRASGSAPCCATKTS